MTIRRNGFYGTYHVVNAGTCTYYEFALEAARLLGLPRAQIDPLIEITHERDMQRVAERPRFTPLRCLLSEELGLPPMRDWRAALAAYVRGLGRVSSIESWVSHSCPPHSFQYFIIPIAPRSD